LIDSLNRKAREERKERKENKTFALFASFAVNLEFRVQPKLNNFGL
jgi:hypothetical protein